MRLRHSHTRLQALQGDRGASLLVALAILVVLAVAAGAAIEYTNANTRSAEVSKDRSRASSVSEAGVSQALSILNNASDPSVASLLPPKR